MRNAKKWTAVAGVGLAVVMLALVALPAAADTTVAAPVQHRSGPMGGGSNDTYLAEALGITAAELQEAQQAAYEAAIDQGLEEGLITQAQADALKERSGTLGGRFGGRGLSGLFGLTGSTIDTDALLADALGITADELAAARVEAQGLALAAAVEDGRLTQEQADQMKARQSLQTYMEEQGFWSQARSLYENLVQKAVEAGVITQEQADAILSDTGRFDGMRGFEGMRGFDGMRGHGGMWMPGMRGFNVPGTPGTDTAPSGTRFQRQPSFGFDL